MGLFGCKRFKSIKIRNFTPLDLSGLIKPIMIETDIDENSGKLDVIINQSNIIYIFGMSLGILIKFGGKELRNGWKSHLTIGL